MELVHGGWNEIQVKGVTGTRIQVKGETGTRRVVHDPGKGQNWYHEGGAGNGRNWYQEGGTGSM